MQPRFIRNLLIFLLGNLYEVSKIAKEAIKKLLTALNTYATIGIKNPISTFDDAYTILTVLRKIILLWISQ